MNNELIEKVLGEVRKSLDLKNFDQEKLNKVVESTTEKLADSKKEEVIKEAKPDTKVPEESKQTADDVKKVPSMTEFVGTASGDTVGLVIANVDSLLHKHLGLDNTCRSIGIISARVGAPAQMMAADDAVKATNTEVATIELPRDTKGGAGHGIFIVLKAADVSDARRAVEVALKNTDKYMGNVYLCDAGHLEVQYTARASLIFEKAFGAPSGQAFGIMHAAPAGVGMIVADTALKTADVELITYGSPTNGVLSYTNEILITISGDSGAVLQSLTAARKAGLSILRSMGQDPVSMSKPTF
ncbi:propanediol utilization microcompartment protein PduB [Clostridium kluyveri]|uniref:Microcompartment protein PduB n=1 Tax=Clostridium kluyveri TaxID=1534 RepID=A0A1L5F6I9_CLOKL|nr:propanediol utilization microcompartment protein PduB [Clostridium kluyveri]APM38450.1 microcompartment protein PduB [Clostridium kluyveri]